MAATAEQSAGGKLAAGLLDSVGTATQQVSPHEDVRGYLQQTLLPSLGPAIEQLLHHIHESGELQRALREKAEAERQARRLEARRLEARRSTQGASHDGAATGGTATPGEKTPTGGESMPPMQDAAAAEQQAAAESETVAEPEAFDPLVWLSEQLRKSAAGPTTQYREQIEQRVRQQIAAAEAALLEEGEEEAEAEGRQTNGRLSLSEAPPLPES
mmetsp:Transcript_67317/g.173332  ORF Transcript_67317/g.173332 Transcript_67317/m.173332 type:complete len:215 (-) Transcript_67317:83-727(-)